MPTISNVAKFALHRLTPQLAEQVASGGPRAGNWEYDYPAEGDTDSAQMYLRQCQDGRDPQPFGPYQIVRLDDGKIIGSAGFHGPPHDGVVEIGYGVVRSARGHGYATAAAREILNIARAEGVRRAIARTETANPASMKVLTNVGMIIVKQEGETLSYAIDL
jgi:RimJ/RimL family protein N-acetyltransferase